jgi:nucleoside-diphosphate-sugar epimerase
MNIVVIGGGKPGKFGNDFCNRARSEGHDVYVISHKDYGTNDPKHIVADFDNPTSITYIHMAAQCSGAALRNGS